MLLGLLAVLTPCLFLALARGGLAAEAQSLACAWIFFALAVRLAGGWRTGDVPRFPPPALILLGWPLLQLVSLPPGLMAKLDPQRAAELSRFTLAGISVAPTISLHPYATVRMFLMLAAALGLFVLTRDLCRRRPRALAWLAAGVIVLGLVEAVPALRQYALLQTGAVTPAGAGDDFIRGTFGNRNLLAAWLEGCYGVALVMASTRRRSATWTIVCALAAVILAAVVILSFSRMGILGIAAESVFLGCVTRRGRRPGPARAAAIAGVLVFAGVVGWTGIAWRYAASSLALEREGRFAMWDDSVRAVRRYPLAGAGAGAFPSAFRRSHPYLTGYTIDHAHNEYLETAVEWGVPLTLALLGGMAVALVRIFRGLKGEQNQQRQIALGCLAGALAMVLHAAVDFPLRIPAILALFCTLLGMAAGVGRAGVASGRSGRRATGAMVLLWLGLGAFSLWPIPASAEGHYAAGRHLFLEGRIEETAAAHRRALGANPYAAPVWRELAWIAESRGDAPGALEFADLAQILEPHTKRGEWAAANLCLRLGENSKAAALFAALLNHAPELRRTAWDLCARAGVSVSGRDREPYLLHLVERRQWEALEDTCARVQPSPEVLHMLFLRLFDAGQSERMLRLWRLWGPAQGGFSNGDLAAPLRNWGLDWTVEPVEVVRVERRVDGGSVRLDVEFTSPQNIAYTGVAHDFEVTPGSQYRLYFEAAANEVGSTSGIQVEVVSHHRRLAASECFRRTTGWKKVELRFRPLRDERVCRLRIVRRAEGSFDNRVTGRFSVRQFSLLREGTARRAPTI